MEFYHGKRPRPQKSPKLQRKKRSDAGKVRRSMATLLSGVILSHEEEKAILNNNSYDIKITENGNSRAITNCTEMKEASDHPSEKYKKKYEDDDREPRQVPEIQVNDSHAHESENFLVSGKNCSEKGFELKEGFKSRMDGQQEVSICNTHLSGWETSAHYFCYFYSYKSH